MSTEVPVAVGDRPAGRLTYRQARESPCLTCSSSPCCTYLALRKLTIGSLLDLDYAFYLMNFEGIVLGFAPNGGVRVYLHQPCGFLDQPSGLCTVHGTPAQPSICSHYDAHLCKYRHIMTVDVHPGETLVDRRRLSWFADHVTFDDERRVIDRPEWSDMLAAFAAMPLERRPAPPPPPDPVAEEWRSVVLSPSRSARPEPLASCSDPVVNDPCQSCPAWCCNTLVFSHDVPETFAQLDFFRYALGFPGVRVGVAEDGWALVVRTTCRHLDGGRCSVYGTDERPLRCASYDELKCTYRVHFGTPQPEELVLIDRAHFPALAQSIAFDQGGLVRVVPSTEELRSFVETAEREAAGLPG
jgi:Fe-S-cluster containining protein